MRTSALRAAIAGLLLGCVCAAPAQAAEQPILSPAGTTKFPDRAFRLTVPEKLALTAQQITVTENGEPVKTIDLASRETSTTDFGTVLVIDASKSMQGAAIERATGAARELARQRRANQQLGVIAFNNAPRVLVAPTTDGGAIDQALAAPPKLAPQTRIFDAVDMALDLLEAAKITAGSIVVLSDGADTGSVAPRSDVSRRARRSNVRIYTVGLKSRSFDRSELADLAAAGRGRYVSAATTDLAGIFRRLGAELASEYLVRYRSSTPPGRSVTVAVRVDGVEGVAVTTYVVPGGTSFVLVEDNFWTSTAGIIVTTLLCVLLLAVAMALLLVRRHRRPGVRERVSGFVSSAASRPTRSARSSSWGRSRAAPPSARSSAPAGGRASRRTSRSRGSTWTRSGSSS